MGTTDMRLPEAMGCDWMTQKECSQAIPPAYTEWIGRQLMRVSYDRLVSRLPPQGLAWSGSAGEVSILPPEHPVDGRPARETSSAASKR